MAESYSVEAFLRVTGADRFINDFRRAAGQIDGVERSSRTAGLTLTKLAASIGLVAVAAKGFQMLRDSLDGAIARYDTLSGFPKVLQLMGFSAQDSQKAIDKLSKGIDGLPTTLDSVAKTTQRIATMTGDLDGAVDTTIALNNAFLASGASSADAARGLEQYVQMMAAGKVDMQSWRTLQETMPVALNRTAEAFGFAGRSAQNDLYEALKAGEITFDEFNAKLIELNEGVGGFAELARTSSTGIATSWQNIKTNVVKGLADMIATIDESLASFGGISGILDLVKEGIKTFFSFVNGNIPIVIERFKEVYNTLKPWLPVIASIVTGILTFYVAVGAINSVRNAVLGLASTFGRLFGILTANPIALVIAVLAGLAVMFMHLWNTSETFRTAVTNTFNTLLSFVMPIVQTIVNFVMEIWGTLVAWWNENNQMILQAAQNVWNVISTVITTVMNVIWTIMQTVWPIIQALVVSVWENIKGVIQGAINVITGIIQFFAALFTGNWSALWDAVKQIVSGAVQLVWNLVQLWFVGKILKLGTALFTGLRGIVTNIWNTVKSLFTSGVNVARNVVSTGFNFIRNIISTVMNAVRNVISNIWNGIRNTVTTVVNAIKNTVSNIFNSLHGVVSNAFSRVRSAVSDGINSALQIVRNIAGKFLDAGRNIVTSIADGIKGAIGKVTDAIGNVTQKIRNFLPFSPAKEGPLRDIMKVRIAESIAQAIDKGKNVAVRSMANLTDALYGEMPQVDIAGQVRNIHSQSQRQMNYDFQNEMTISKQPAYINIMIGGQTFSAFVRDITDEQNFQEARMNRFRG